MTPGKVEKSLLMQTFLSKGLFLLFHQKIYNLTVLLTHKKKKKHATNIELIKSNQEWNKNIEI